MSDAQIPAKALARRDLLIGGAYCAGAILGGSASVWSARRALPGGSLQRLIPTQIGEWKLASTHGVVVAEDRNGTGGPYDNLVTRIYQSRVSLPVTLLVAYVGSQRADVRLHRPEACYPAQGFTLSNRELVRFKFAGTPNISAQIILAESPMRNERLLYWTRVGNQFPTSNLTQMAAFVRENLAGSRPDSILVRISVPGSDRNGAWAAFQAFLTALRAGVSPSASRVLFGEPT